MTVRSRRQHILFYSKHETIEGRNQGDLASVLKNDTYDHVDAVVWLVDLFSPPDHGAVLQPQVGFDQKRISEQIAMWKASVDIWRALIGNEVKLWVLFINKADLAIGSFPDIAQRAEAEYKLLNECLAARSAGILLKTIVGSASTGCGIPELTNLLVFKGSKTWHDSPKK